MPVQDWKATLNRFAIVYEVRLPVPSRETIRRNETATQIRALETVEKSTAFFHGPHDPTSATSSPVTVAHGKVADLPG